MSITALFYIFAMIAVAAIIMAAIITAVR